MVIHPKKKKKTNEWLELHDRYEPGHVNGKISPMISHYH